MMRTVRSCIGVLLLTSVGAAARTAAAQQGTPPKPPAAGPALGTFRDIDELSLADLLDRRVSIASAGRVQRVEEAPSIVSVITDEDIRRMGARTVSDVLRTVPGFDVIAKATGADEIIVRGKRGYEDSDVLILMNGQRLNDAVTNQVMFFNRSLPLGNVRQIEVVRGPGSAVYGAYAFGGVVNIVTHTPQTLSGIQVAAQAGSFGSARASVATGHAWGDLSIGTSFEAGVTDGPRLDAGADLQTIIDRLAYQPAGIPPASRAPTRTRDAVRSADARLFAAYRGTTLGAYARGDRMRGGYFGAIDVLPADDRHRTQSMGADVNHRWTIGSRGGLRLSSAVVQNVFRAHHTVVPAGFVRRFSDGVVVQLPTGGILDFTYANRRAEGSAVVDLSFGAVGQLVMGVGLQRESTFDEHAASNYDLVGRVARPAVAPIDPLIPHSSRTIASAFVQQSWNPVPSLGLTAGIRHDRYSDVGSTTNPRLGVVWRLPSSWYAKALYGRAFKAPTFEQLHANIPTLRRGDPTLRPAVIETRELAGGWSRGDARIGANYFAETVWDRFVPAFSETESIIAGNEYTFANGSPLRTRGVELEARKGFGLHHALFGAYTYQVARTIDSGERSGDVPGTLFNVGGTVGMSAHVHATLMVLHRGTVNRSAGDFRRDPAVAQQLGLPLQARVPAHTLVNLNLRFLNYLDVLEVAATVSNLFGVRYVDPALANAAPLDYPQPGRAAHLKASYRF